jgi:hypothetical protein
VLQDAAHDPELHTPPSHEIPQPPQFFGSKLVSMQTPASAQLLVPDGQMHWPASWAFWAEQISVHVHAAPQAPQLLVLLVVSTQAPLHLTRFPEQVALQVPRLQTWLLVHAVPQEPQLFGSVYKSTQPALPHTV